jgi:hypothetical protein
LNLDGGLVVVQSLQEMLEFADSFESLRSEEQFEQLIEFHLHLRFDCEIVLQLPLFSVSVADDDPSNHVIEVPLPDFKLIMVAKEGGADREHAVVLLRILLNEVDD